MYLPYKYGSDKFILFFHGNAEDLGHSLGIMKSLRKNLKLNVIGIEYPGYGIYKNGNSSSSE